MYNDSVEKWGNMMTLRESSKPNPLYNGYIAVEVKSFLDYPEIFCWEFLAFVEMLSNEL